MKRLLTLIFILTVVLWVSQNVFADAYLADANTLKWGPGPDPANPANQLWFAYTDWTQVPGSLQLDSAYPEDPETQPWPGTFNAAFMGLQITSPNMVNGSLQTPTGYEFDLATAGITGKVVSKLNIINAYWNYPASPLPVIPTFYDEDGNVVYCGAPAIGWWAGIEVDFANYPTKKVKFVLDPGAAAWCWPGNLMYLEQISISLINQSQAKCGTKYNLSPLADLNQNCVVNMEDAAVFALYWMKCNDPANASCGQ